MPVCLRASHGNRQKIGLITIDQAGVYTSDKPLWFKPMGRGGVLLLRDQQGNLHSERRLELLAVDSAHFE